MAELPVLRSALLADLPGVRHAFFSRKGGVSKGIYEGLNVGRGSKDDPRDVAENRRRAAAHFGAEPGALLTCHQIHSTVVTTADAPWGDARPEADGVATTTPVRSVTSSGLAVESRTRTGVPHASASAVTFPNDSSSDRFNKTSAVA